MFNASVETFKSSVMGKKVAVVGLGVSNIPAIDFLNECGAVITACDKNPPEKFDGDVLKKLEKSCDYLYLGENYLDFLNGQDIILKSPGILPIPPQIAQAQKNGAVLTSEMEIFMSLCPCTMIGVTGSDGKTTTTTLIYEILKKAGYRCHVGGNIGAPLIGKLNDIKPDDMVVLELSSFQLMNMKVSPDIAVITNISPNHLDHHKDMTEYVEAKAEIFKNQNETGRLIVNRDNAITASFFGKQKGKIEFFSRRYHECEAYVEDGHLCHCGQKIVKADEIRIRGWHNVENYLAAICAVRQYVSVEDIEDVAVNFGGVEHRMEFVRKTGGVEFYNDSIGSSPTRTIAGLVAHRGKIVLIAGGYDKNLDYGEFGKIVAERVSHLVLIGATAEKIEKAVAEATKNKRGIPVDRANTLEEAVNIAYRAAKNLIAGKDGISVILSPASASFDMFKNFMVRGNKFKEIVNGISGNDRSAF